MKTSIYQNHILICYYYLFTFNMENQIVDKKIQILYDNYRENSYVNEAQ